MARNVTPSQPKKRSSLQAVGVPSAVKKLTRRLEEVRSMSLPNDESEISTLASTIITKVNATYDDVYGVDTIEAEEGHISDVSFSSWVYPTPWHEELRIFQDARGRVIAKIQTTIDLLNERVEADEDAIGDRVLRAYENLDLHRDIANAASSLYKNGHYANAIEDAVKALNNLVRLKSGIDEDGAKLMTRVFSQNNPVLKFNSLTDASDRDEQQGFMMLFTGAVAGLRNPRAHKLIEDDAERALEFIAFVSLLAKLLESAKK